MQFSVTKSHIKNCVHGQMICPKTVHMEARLYVRLHAKELTGVSHLTLAYTEGVDGCTGVPHTDDSCLGL